MIKNCEGIPYPVYVGGFVKECKSVENAVPKNSVYELTVQIEESDVEPAAGQFYMIHAERSNCLLGRPISIFDAEKIDGKVVLKFLILLKGKGTEEICICVPTIKLL